METVQWRHFWLIILFVLIPAGVVRAELDANVTVPSLLRDCSGIYVKDLKSGRVIVASNPKKTYIPASVTKAVTAASVMSLCDSTERFRTEIVATGRVSGGQLDGNVIIKCNGDPTVGSRHFKKHDDIADEVIAALCSHGIKSVNGDVIIDSRGFDGSDGIPAGWSDEDLVWPYGAELFGANFCDNTVAVTMPSKKIVPVTPALDVVHEVSKGPIRYSRERGEGVIRATGTLPRKKRTVSLVNPKPWSTMKEHITSRMKTAGIDVMARKFGGKLPETVIGVYKSPRYIDILRSLMYRSDNLMAEGMLRTIAPGSSRSEALLEQSDIWGDFDLDVKGIVVEDGSGLSRSNRLTPQFLGNLLSVMATGSVGRSYVELFPRAGMDGTMRNFMAGTPLEGRIAMKTGSMKGVQSYAGYLLDDKGMPTHVVVFIANDFNCSRSVLRQELARMLTELFCPDLHTSEQSDL